MLLRALTDVLKLWSDWDFFVNLSALDFPIESDEKLVCLRFALNIAGYAAQCFQPITCTNVPSIVATGGEPARSELLLALGVEKSRYSSTG